MAAWSWLARLRRHGVSSVAARQLALLIAEEIEEPAAVYCGTMALGGPTLLDTAEMETILKRFRRHGQT